MQVQAGTDRNHRIARIEVRILDIPTIRPHKLSFGAISRQSPVIVQVWLANGASGFGEAATIGGPSWNEESPESILHAIQNYLGPAAIDQDAGRLEALLVRMNAACKGNWFAKSALEMAVIDALARSLDLPAWQLLGGKRVENISLAWTLASGDLEKDLEEAEKMLQARRHRIFKLKIGARTPEQDVAHVSAIARALGERASLTIDVNQAWDFNTARRCLPALVEAGVRLIEQPVAHWNVDALQDLCALPQCGLIMADESVCLSQDALMLAHKRASHVFSLKVAKHGGLLRTRKVAAVAEAADIAWYGGTMLETALGSAASAQLFSTLQDTPHGCELFGPRLMVDEIVKEPLVMEEFALRVPDGPGFGVEIDPAKLQRFDRNGGGAPVVIDLGHRPSAN